MNFALRSGLEHHRLEVTKIELVDSTLHHILMYTENYSKNNAGGLSHRQV